MFLRCDCKGFEDVNLIKTPQKKNWFFSPWNKEPENDSGCAERWGILVSKVFAEKIRAAQWIFLTSERPDKSVFRILRSAPSPLWVRGPAGALCCALSQPFKLKPLQSSEAAPETKRSRAATDCGAAAQFETTRKMKQHGDKIYLRALRRRLRPFPLIQPFLSVVSTCPSVLVSSLLSDWQAVVSKLWTSRKKRASVSLCVWELEQVTPVVGGWGRCSGGSGSLLSFSISLQKEWKVVEGSIFLWSDWSLRLAFLFQIFRNTQISKQKHNPVLCSSKWEQLILGV